MDQFTASYLSELTASLTASLLEGLTTKLRTSLQGGELPMALDRALDAGVIALVTSASGAQPHETAHLDGIFRRFFGEPKVGRELANILRHNGLDMDEMRHLFAEAGYDADTLPHLDFEVGMQAFQGAFLLAAIEEPELNRIIQAQSLLEQAQLQQSLLGEMRKLVAVLRNAAAAEPIVRHGAVVVGGESVFNFTVQAGGGFNPVFQDSVVHLVVNQYVTEHPAAGQSAEDLRQQLLAYLKWVMTECESLSLRAISSGKTTGDEEPPELAAVYVALNTRESKRKPGTRDEFEPLTALEALAKYRRMVLLGDPGSGKSTFIKHLAFCLAAQGVEPVEGWLGRLANWPGVDADRLPVLVTLRDFARWLDPLPKEADVRHLWDFIVATLQKQKLDKAVPLIEAALSQGRGLLLLDGLDEVTDVDQRRFVRDAVEKFSTRFNDNMLLVSCRILSYQAPDEEKEEEDLRLAPEFRSMALAEFDHQQRADFVEAWYAELKRRGHLPGQDESALSRDLRQAIRRPDLQRVAGNPLLLTVMAMVHVEEGKLPDSRAKLYDKTIDLLLSRWETTKDPDAVPLLRQLLDEANRTDADLTARLAEVAYVVHTQAGSKSTDDEHTVADISESYLSSELSRLNRKQLGWGQALLAVIKERAGLLIERLPGQFAFPHRTFQEYLAGAHLASQLDFKEQALEWAGKDAGWWPMILFAVEYLVYVQTRPLDVLDLVSKLCPKEPPETQQAWRLVWLAGEAMLGLGVERAEDSEWGADLLERVCLRLGCLLDQGELRVLERAAAGRTLALLGDPREGVGTTVREADGLELPDIAYGKTVPAGSYRLPKDDRAFRSLETRTVTIAEPYQLSRYPVTFAQFECFVRAKDFDDPRWWADMPEEEKAFGTTYKLRELSEQAFPYANHPRELVSWYQAMAFCRWLNDKLDDGTQINLPHEDQWEVAARTSDASVADGRAYPWGNTFDARFANTDEGEKVGQTTAVGMYPQGKQPVLELYDLSGNVWEWCRNKYGDPGMETPDKSGDSRVLRGGSWHLNQNLARASNRNYAVPYFRRDDLGFRVVRVVAHLTLIDLFHRIAGRRAGVGRPACHGSAASSLCPPTTVCGTRPRKG